MRSLHILRTFFYFLLIYSLVEFVYWFIYGRLSSGISGILVFLIAFAISLVIAAIFNHYISRGIKDKKEDIL